MSKRKAPEAGGTAAGKRKLDEPTSDFDEDDASRASLTAQRRVAGAQKRVTSQTSWMAARTSLADALGADGDDGDMLAAFADADGGEEEEEDEGEDEDDEPQNYGEHLPEQVPAAPFTAEVGELPDSLTEEALSEGETVDLSGVELTLEQARRVAQLLATNDDLTTIKLQGRSWRWAT